MEKLPLWDLLSISRTSKDLRKESIETFRHKHCKRRIEILQYQYEMLIHPKFKFSAYDFFDVNEENKRDIYPPYIDSVPRPKYATIFHFLEIFGPYMDNLTVLIDDNGSAPLLEQVMKHCPQNTPIIPWMRLQYSQVPDNHFLCLDIVRFFKNTPWNWRYWHNSLFRPKEGQNITFN